MSRNYSSRDVSMTPYRTRRGEWKLGSQCSQRLIAGLAVGDPEALRALVRTAEVALWKLDDAETLDDRVREAFPDLIDRINTDPLDIVAEDEGSMDGSLGAALEKLATASSHPRST